MWINRIPFSHVLKQEVGLDLKPVASLKQVIPVHSLMYTDHDCHEQEQVAININIVYHYVSLLVGRDQFL